jgi:hypothetical protein
MITNHALKKTMIGQPIAVMEPLGAATTHQVARMLI